MTTDELEHLPDRLAALLADRDWEDASAEVNKAAGLIRSLPVPLSPALAARLISPLNRNRRFADRPDGSLLWIADDLSSVPICIAGLAECVFGQLPSAFRQSSNGGISRNRPNHIR